MDSRTPQREGHLAQGLDKTCWQIHGPWDAGTDNPYACKTRQNDTVQPLSADADGKDGSCAVEGDGG